MDKNKIMNSGLGTGDVRMDKWSKKTAEYNAMFQNSYYLKIKAEDARRIGVTDLVTPKFTGILLERYV